MDNYHPAYSRVRVAEFWSWAAAKGLTIPEPMRDLAGVPAPAPKPEAGMVLVPGKRLKNYFRLLLAMAIEHYGYTTFIKNGAPAKLQALMSVMGQSLGDDAIRDCLKDACEGLETGERPKRPKDAGLPE
jgi:hypothetical protein